MPFDQAHKQYETARHLPPPLYVLFVQASAYGQACGEHRGDSAPPQARFHSCLQESPLLGGLSPLSAVLWDSAERRAAGWPHGAVRQQHLKPCLLSCLAGRSAWEAPFPPLPPLPKVGRGVLAACELAGCCHSLPRAVTPCLVPPVGGGDSKMGGAFPWPCRDPSHGSPGNLHPLRQLWIIRSFLEPP